MRARPTLVAIAVLATALLSSCSTPPSPSPSPSGAPTPTASTEPATLDELEQLLVDEGLVDGSVLDVVDPIGGGDERLHLQLDWLDAPSASEQLAILAEVQGRLDAVLGDERPLTTRVVLTAALDDGRPSSVDVEVDLGSDVLRELLEITRTTPCSDASVTSIEDHLSVVDGDPPVVDVDVMVARLSCAVDVPDAAALAGMYDEIVAIAPRWPLIDETWWEIGASDLPTLRLRVAVEGREPLLVDLLTIAEQAGAEGISVTDSGDRLNISGVVAAGNEPMCTALYDRMVAADVEVRTVAFATPDPPDGEPYDVCFLEP